MTVEPIPQPRTLGAMGFDAFYKRSLPIVYGYALRLCGGSVDRAQDLTQEAWVRFVDQVRAGRADHLDVRWLIAVVRNGYVDQWPRSRRLENSSDWCGTPAYRDAVPLQCCEGEHWFPFDVEEEPPAPTIDVDADGIWVRRHRFSWINESDESGFVESAFAAVRVGRIVTTIDVPLIKSGARVATVDDFERIVQTLAARAAEVQE